MVTFADKPTITGERVVLRPIVAAGAAHLWDDLHDTESIRFTGTHATFTREQIDAWCATRAEHVDRLDLAVIDRATRRWAGDVVVNDWDPGNRSCGFRREGRIPPRGCPRPALRWDDEFHDTIVMSIVRSDRGRP